ncbi:MAG: hypothetical protein RMK74_17240 [Myxococcales bacterium]|nr:hypothetical protein [Myxococcales bacterium]
MADATPPWVERVIARIDALHAQDPNRRPTRAGSPSRMSFYERSG